MSGIWNLVLLVSLLFPVVTEKSATKCYIIQKGKGNYSTRCPGTHISFGCSVLEMLHLGSQQYFLAPINISVHPICVISVFGNEGLCLSSQDFQWQREINAQTDKLWWECGHFIEVYVSILIAFFVASS